jgi:hypothetical protein
MESTLVEYDQWENIFSDHIEYLSNPSIVPQNCRELSQDKMMGLHDTCLIQWGIQPVSGMAKDNVLMHILIQRVDLAFPIAIPHYDHDDRESMNVHVYGTKRMKRMIKTSSYWYN